MCRTTHRAPALAGCHLHFATEKRGREVGGAVENAGYRIRDVQVDGLMQQDRRRVMAVNAVVAN